VGQGRLGDELGEAGLERRLAVFSARVRRQRDGRHRAAPRRGPLTDPPHHRQPVLAGHADVGDDGSGDLEVELGDGFGCALHRDHARATVAQHRPHQVARRFVVVHDEHELFAKVDVRRRRRA
jgi:hypothetical protein